MWARRWRRGASAVELQHGFASSLVAKRPRVLIAYSYPMHYRLGVFEALVLRHDLDVDLVAGDVADKMRGGVAQISPESLPSMRVVRTFNIMGFWWQPEMVRRALWGNYDAVVMDPSLKSLSVWLIAIGRRIVRRPVLFWGLGWTKPHNRWKEWLKTATFRICDQFLTYGQESMRRATENGFPADRLSVVGNSLADSVPARTLQPKSRNGRSIVLLVSVRLTQRKRIDLLLQAAAYLSVEYDVRVIIVGSGPEEGNLRGMAEELGVTAEFRGAVYEAEALALIYSQADITVLPGHAGLTVVQSLMHGTPVVTHDDPDRHAAEWEAISGPLLGGFFKEGDAKDLARVLGEKRELLREDAGAVFYACRSEYRSRWSPHVQAGAVAEEVLKAMVRGGNA